MTREVFAYITLLLTELIKQISKRKCPGCLDGKRASLNHFCLQSSLLDKFEAHFSEVSGKVSGNMVAIIGRFLQLYPELSVHRENILAAAQNFILCSTAKSIYFGGYVEDESICQKLLDSLASGISFVEGKPIPTPIPTTNTPAAKKSGQVRPPTSKKRKSQPSVLEQAIAEAYDEEST